MRKTELKTIVNEGLATGKRYLIVKIETEGSPAPELIINPLENIRAKMDYYSKVYNDDLELIRAKETGKSIRIVDAMMTNNFNDLVWFVF